jgi:hypothetical protein
MTCARHLFPLPTRLLVILAVDLVRNGRLINLVCDWARRRHPEAVD